MLYCDSFFLARTPRPHEQWRLLEPRTHDPREGRGCMSARELLATWTAWFEGLGAARFQIVRAPLARALGERRYGDLPWLADQVCRAMLVDPEGACSEIGQVSVMVEEIVHSLRPIETRAEVPACGIVAISDLVNAFDSVGTPLPHIIDVNARSLLADLEPAQLSDDERVRAGLAALASGDLELTRRFDTGKADTLHAFLTEMSGERDPVMYPNGATVLPIIGRALVQGIDAVTLLWLGRLAYRNVMGEPPGQAVRATRGYVERAIRRDEMLRQAEAEERVEAKAAAVAFPHGALVANGSFRITELLCGLGPRQLWRALRVSDGHQALVAIDARLSRISVEVMRVDLAARGAMEVGLAYVGETDDPPPLNHHWLCVELAMRGTWLPDLLVGNVSPAQAIELVLSAGRLLARALANGTLMAGVRPEYMWGVRDGERFEVTAASDRSYWLFARKTYDLVTRPPFERDYAAPEARNEPSERSLVYSLARMLVDWAGETPPALVPLLERAQNRDPAERPGLEAFLADLRAAV